MLRGQSQGGLGLRPPSSILARQTTSSLPRASESSEEERASLILDRYAEPRKNGKDGQAARVKKGKKNLSPAIAFFLQTAFFFARCTMSSNKRG